MRLEKISLQHRDILAERFKAARTFVSEFSFANLYLFRDAHDHHVLTDGGDLFVTGKTYDGLSYVMPTTDVRAAGCGALVASAADKDIIFPVPEEWLAAFDPQQFTRSFWEGDSDYIYHLERIATYQGQKLHKRKNLLNQFLALYVPRAEGLTRERMGDARQILEAWQDDAGEPRDSTDHAACLEALELYEELVLCGWIYYVNDEPAGFIIGEELNGRMFVFHFAKGRRKFKGLYQFMYHHFARTLPEKYEFLNFEQDMGNLALKIAKSSYYPDRMLAKYRLKVRL